MNITLLYSLPTPHAIRSEFIQTDEDTKLSAEIVAKTLSDLKHQVKLIGLTHDGKSLIHQISTDIIFNMIEWTGRDLPHALEAIRKLEKLHIPFTGVDSKSYQNTSDKKVHKTLLDKYGISTPKWQFVDQKTSDIRGDLTYPLIVKSAIEHCSIGLTEDCVVDNHAELLNLIKEKTKSFPEGLIIEEFIHGREFQVTLLEKNGIPTVLPPAEIVFLEKDKSNFLSYGVRWDESHPYYYKSKVEITQLDQPFIKDIVDISITAFKKFNLADYARLDIRVDKKGRIFVLEANSNPGLEDSTGYGLSASFRAAGLTFGQFLEIIIQSALWRYKKNS